MIISFFHLIRGRALSPFRILFQNTERRKGAYAPGGYGGLKIAAGSFTGTDRSPIFM